MEANAELGKISQDEFVSVIFPQLGASRKEVVQGSSFGADFSAIRVAGKKVLLISCDPVSYIPELGAEDSAYISVESVAADLLTSGNEPTYASFVLTIPPYMERSTFRKYWGAISRECRRIGIAVVAGHTGIYDGCNYSIIGSASMMTIADAGRYVSSSMAKPGNKLIMTKSAGIETTFIFARSFPETVKKALGSSAYEEASSFRANMSVYEDALSASSTGMRSKGVTAMHDVAEGGVLGAIYELAEASSVGVMVYADRIPVAGITSKICNLFSLDPLTTLGEGSLLIASPPSKERKVIESLRKSGIPATSIGKIVDKREGRIIVREGSEERLKPVSSRSYWEAYSSAKSQGIR